MRTIAVSRAVRCVWRTARSRSSVFAAAAAWVAAVWAPAARAGEVPPEPAPAAAFRSIAFFYGDPVPVDRLAQFEAVVVEPDGTFDPRASSAAGHEWFAYVSVGEVSVGRRYYQAIPKRWFIGRNEQWGSTVVDQSVRGWPAFFVTHVVAPLWARGYRGFFLDTLDSYQLIAKDERTRARQRDGIIAVIRAIKARYPQAKLILNRGFELLPRVHDDIAAVAFESLYGSWNQSRQRYGEVSSNDREWLLSQARTVREKYGLPVISIDYCAPGDVRRREDIARRIVGLGIIPYVTDGALATVGVGPPARASQP